MKRADNLFEQITDYNNLRLAYLKALKGKRFTPAAIIFDLNADKNLYRIKNQLENGTYVFGNYWQFKIYDPKERTITAATFENRIVHHAIMNVLEPIFERQFIFHTYACRKGKGSHKAIKYAQNCCRKSEYYLKLDVRKYFDNINHSVLKQKLCHIIKDDKCLKVLFDIIDSYSINALSVLDELRGLPIGNLTSQFFANFYLSSLDHFVLENLKTVGYVRYMDDIIVFANYIQDLKIIYNKMSVFIKPMFLQFKPPVFNRCKTGVPFLGYLIFSYKTHLLQKARKRQKIPQ